MLVSCATDKGLVRLQNEDSYLAYEGKTFAVADGMGGHAAGEIASNIIIDTIRDEVALKEGFSKEFLIDLVKEANSKIFRDASQNEEYAGMGSTISLLHLDLKDRNFIWVHVGDSRIYLLRDGELRQITTDHSFINELMQHQEEIPVEIDKNKGKNILTRAVGVAYTLKVDSGSEAYRPGDKFVLCTDGLTNMVADEVIKDICLGSEENKAQILVDEALANGGRDNVTCIVVEIYD